MVEICRWPKASYKALVICETVMPRRLAMSRSITRYTCRPLSCRSLATSASSARCCSACTSLPLHCASRSASGDDRLNWYWVRLTRSSILRSWTGCMNRRMPTSLSSCGCRRLMTSPAVTSRSPCGLRLISRRPLLSVALSPSTPM
ncbi:hypothetical protein D3C81_1289870 [compost metagenome]